MAVVVVSSSVEEKRRVLVVKVRVVLANVRERVECVGSAEVGFAAGVVVLVTTPVVDDSRAEEVLEARDVELVKAAELVGRKEEEVSSVLEARDVELAKAAELDVSFAYAVGVNASLEVVVSTNEGAAVPVGPTCEEVPLRVWYGPVGPACEDAVRLCVYNGTDEVSVVVVVVVALTYEGAAVPVGPTCDDRVPLCVG